MRNAPYRTFLPALAASMTLPLLAMAVAAQNDQGQQYQQNDQGQWWDPTDWFEGDQGRNAYGDVDQSQDTTPYGWQNQQPGYDSYWYDDAGGYNDYYDNWWNTTDDYGYGVWSSPSNDQWDWSQPTTTQRNNAYDYQGQEQDYGQQPYYGQGYDQQQGYGNAASTRWRWSQQQNRWVPAGQQQGAQSQNGQSQESQGQNGQNQASPGQSQQSQGSQSRSSSGQQQQGQMQFGSQQATLSGRLDGYRRVNLQGTSEQHTLVRLRMRDGSQRIVNLGPRVEISDLNLSPGNFVRVQGRMGRISGQPVLMATTIDIRPSSGNQQGGSSSSGYAQSGQQNRTTLQGRVSSWTTQNRGNQGGPTLVTLQMDDGTTQTVAFGPNVDLSSYGIRRGDRIAVRGQIASVDNQRALVAQQFRIASSGQNGQMGNRGQVASIGPIGGQQSQQSQKGSGQFATLSGTLQDWTKKNLRNEGQHNFIKLQLQDGSSRIVDLGSRIDASDLGLQQGDRISVRGPMTQIQDRPVLAARQFRIDGLAVGVQSSQPARPGR